MLQALLYTLTAVVLFVPMVASARTYEAAHLECAPGYQRVSVGNAATFSAISNIEGPFMWVTDDTGFVDAGPIFITPFFDPGFHEVAVVWGSRRATCLVEVVGYGSYGDSYGYPWQQGPGPNVTLTARLYPFMPNAGFAPQSAAAWAFAFVLLAGFSIAAYPYVRKAFAIVTR
jgi:hypothetical protein